MSCSSQETKLVALSISIHDDGAVLIAVQDLEKSFWAGKIAVSAESGIYTCAGITMAIGSSCLDIPQIMRRWRMYAPYALIGIYRQSNKKDFQNLTGAAAFVARALMESLFIQKA